MHNDERMESIKLDCLRRKKRRGIKKLSGLIILFSILEGKVNGEFFEEFWENNNSFKKI